MSINLRLAASNNGAKNLFDRTVRFSDYGGAPSNTAAANTTARQAFNTAHAGFTGSTQLIIDAGIYDFSSRGPWGSSGPAGSKLTISAYGATLKNQQGFANAGPNQNNSNNADIATVSAGSSTVSLITPSQVSLFSAGKWVLITNVDMQGGGYPQNSAVFEFKKVQSIGSGALTFTEPLSNSYKSTYPRYNAGSTTQIDQGGPASVYVLPDPWDQEIEFKGAYFTDVADGFYGPCRVARWTDCTFETYGPIPTVCLLYQMTRCTAAGFGGLEIDKCIHRAEFIDSAPRAVDFQSASVNELYVNNVTSSTRWRGGGKSNIFRGLTTPAFEFGVMNYGAMGSTYMENCVSSGATWHSANRYPFSDYTEEGGGVLSYSGGPGPPSQLLSYWAVPGITCVLLDASNGFARTFQVTDLTSSGGRTYVTTTLPYPLPSTINGKSSPWYIAPHPCADATLVNCSGSSLFTSQSALPAHSPLFGWQ